MNIKNNQNKIVQVMIVDDSAVIRSVLTRLINAETDMTVCTTASDGKMAIDKLSRYTVDIIILDIEMPVMDGITALPQLLAAGRGAKIIMASTLTQRNADISLQAVNAGACDYIPKPTSLVNSGDKETFRDELLSKIRIWSRTKTAATGTSTPAGSTGSPLPGQTKKSPGPLTKPDIIAIGSSTGGPQALFEVLGHLSGIDIPPIVITQHMPATFTTILAQHIAKNCKLNCSEAQDGAIIRPGHVYIAPGDHHLTFTRRGPDIVTSLNQEPPVNFCRPAVDPMLNSLAQTFTGRILTLILTGMGQDGLQGCRTIQASGKGNIIAQDEATSIVWGMPGAVTKAGLCDAVLPLKEIGPMLRSLITRSKS